ncbi:MAG: YdcF family protein [Clostridia bacterium]|nr:YdcF family protein [Clostridia bacterium]
MKKPRACEKGKILNILIRIAVILICLIILFALIVLAINGYVMASGKDSVFFSANELNDTGKIDCIVVLGAGLKSDGTPSHMLEDRIKVGVSVLRETGVEYILMSGDRSDIYYDEPAAMKEYAENMGVDPSKILIDNSGYSTYESMTRVASEYGFDNVVVITQEYHLYRALYIADKAGVTAVGVSADLRPYSGQIVRDVREILARVKDFFMCM